MPYRVEIQRDSSEGKAAKLCPRFTYDKSLQQSMLVEYDMVSYADSKQAQPTTASKIKARAESTPPQTQSNIIQEYDLGSMASAEEFPAVMPQVKVTVDIARLAASCMAPVRTTNKIWTILHSSKAHNAEDSSDHDDQSSTMGFWTDMTGNYQTSKRSILEQKPLKTTSTAATTNTTIASTKRTPPLSSCGMDAFWEGILGEDFDDDRTLFSSMSWWTPGPTKTSSVTLSPPPR